MLLVEDEEMVREMTAAMLTHLGFTVLEAKDGVEAVEVFRQHRNEIRCVLSDLTMPRMDGWETLTATAQAVAETFRLSFPADTTRLRLWQAIIPNVPMLSWESHIGFRSSGIPSSIRLRIRKKAINPDCAVSRVIDCNKSENGQR